MELAASVFALRAATRQAEVDVGIGGLAARSAA